MNKEQWKQLFSPKAFIPFLTAGDPDGDHTVEYILDMEKAGADLIEIGIPFSDPTAEGPVIQEASIRALQGGMTTEGVFQIVEQVRKKSQVPLALMTYLNPVFHYGYEAFCSRCQTLGICALIIPDLPYEEKGELVDFAKNHDIALISMIAPTSRNRIQKIAREAEGFIYLVSSMGVTGMRKEITTDIGTIVAHIREVTDVPVAVGFGISTPDQAREMAALSDGAIVGSAIVRLIGQHGQGAGNLLAGFVKEMKESILQKNL